MTRIGLIVVLVWIGGLKVFHYEGEGIVPFVANSPLMSFFYKGGLPMPADGPDAGTILVIRPAVQAF